MRIVPLGDTALSVEWGQQIDSAIQAQVLALDPVLAALPGVLETVPSYASIMLRYDPELTDFESLFKAISRCSSAEAPAHRAQHWRVPACYTLGEDLSEAAQLLAISEQALIEAHTRTHFRIALYGFAPGWAYLSGCPEILHLPRRAKPRPPTPDSALLIAGGQAMLAAAPMPTGWYVIGRSAQPALRRESDPPVCFAVGDSVSFYAVDAESWQSLRARAEAGEMVAERCP